MTPSSAEGKQTRRKPSGYRSIEEEFHIRKRVVEVEVDIRRGTRDQTTGQSTGPEVPYGS
jgi:hypothetical protein